VPGGYRLSHPPAWQDQLRSGAWPVRP
jgi:hypothetical protein